MQHLEFVTERLEQRKMLAGDVSVRLDNGDLRIQGDHEGNNIDVVLIAGEVVVMGQLGTTINGSDSEFTVDGISDDLVVNLRGGNNRFYIEGVDVPDDIKIRTGNGNDRIFFQIGSTAGDDVRIQSGGGGDYIVLANETADDLKVSTGSGNDFVRLTLGEVANDARINTGSGDDAVAMETFDVGDLRINLGGGNDIALSHDVTAATARILGGGGDDLWFDCINDMGPADLFTVAEASSMDASESNDVLDMIADLVAQYSA